MKCTRPLFLTLIFFLITGCSEISEDKNEAESRQQTRGVSPSEIVIGSHTDLSGPVAIWGVGSINGARMRVAIGFVISLLSRPKNRISR